MALVGRLEKLSRLAASLRQLPVTLALRVAEKAAPAITDAATAAFDGGSTVFGDRRPLGKHGALTLVQSGATRALMRFVAIGTRVRVALGTRYAKFLVGKYKILPSGRLPVEWSDTIGKLAKAEIAQQLGGP